MSFLIRSVCVVALAAGCGSASAGGAPGGDGGDATAPAPDGGSGNEAGGGHEASSEAGPAGDAGMSTDSADGDGGTTVPIVPAFYVATNGSDSNDGTEASPFATFARAQTAMQASSTMLSGTPTHTPTIANNDYYNYGGAAISTGSGAYGDTAPASIDPQLSGWDYSMSPASAVLLSPVSFPPLVGGWGPPGYVLPQTGTPPSSPH